MPSGPSCCGRARSRGGDRPRCSARNGGRRRYGHFRFSRGGAGSSGVQCRGIVGVPGAQCGSASGANSVRPRLNRYGTNPSSNAVCGWLRFPCKHAVATDEDIRTARTVCRAAQNAPLPTSRRVVVERNRLARDTSRRSQRMRVSVERRVGRGKDNSAIENWKDAFAAGLSIAIPQL